MKNFFLACKEIRIEPTSPKTYYGSFYLGPFKSGQGLTVANALRRTLLSEISGLAITGVELEGSSHEYMTLVGVRETVLDILLNFKEIVLKKKSPQMFRRSQWGYLQVRGPGIVRACHLKLPPHIECVDPDQYIATLTENGSLNLKFRMDEGEGFQYLKPEMETSNVKPRSLEAQSNFLSVDALFTPIKKVNYTIESYGAKSIEKANEVIIFEIWTNGSLSPKEVLSKSLNYLRVLFNQLGDLQMLQSVVTTYSFQKNQKFRKIVKNLENQLDSLKLNLSKKKRLSFNLPENPNKELFLKTSQNSEFVEKNSELLNSWENLPIYDLNLPFRLFQSLTEAKIQTVTDLLKLNSEDIQKIPGIEPEIFSFLKKVLKRKGFTLKE